MEIEPRSQASEYDRRQVRGTGPYEVEVAGGLHEVRMPPLCACCGAAPVGTLPVTRLFRRTYRERSTDHVIATLRVPFCLACLEAHEAERRRPDPAVLRRLRNRWLVRSLPYVIPIVVLTWLLAQLVPSATASIVAFSPEHWIEPAVWLAVVLFSGLLLLGFAYAVLAARRLLIADHDGATDDLYVERVRGPMGTDCVLPVPPTRTLAAVNFTDEEFELLDRNRRTFIFTNLEVATAFAAANADLVWQPNSPRAIRARWGSYVVIGGLLLVGAVLWLRDLLGW